MRRCILTFILCICMFFQLMSAVALPAAAAGSSQFDSILNMG